MVSNARLDLPEPERPVTTVRLLRGISTEMFFRLWTRAPCTATVVRMSGRLVLFAIGEKERQLLQRRGTALRRAHRRRRLGNDVLIGEVLARGGHPHHAVAARKVRLEVAGRAHVACVAQVIEDRRDRKSV